ncbi:MAG: FAD-dependent oxidoreductase [Desulfobacteraceae bacterium]|nr:MAG: FAD-dependent oxidoreductase [Desulfobacteraceae bacterium]
MDGEPGRFSARIRQEPRYIDTAKCTSCGECAKVCPIEVSNEYDKFLSLRRAAFKKYAQAIPGAYAITKRGTAPCKATCPAHVSIQGYIALINQGKYKEAIELFREDHPFPAVCGRVCHHPCEGECTRGDYDEPLAIRELHRFLADWEREQEQEDAPAAETAAETAEKTAPEKRDEKIAIIGAGPAGLTAAAYLARQGYTVTIFEKLPVAGGMMAVGIPEYRLPRDILAAEINLIEQMGVEIRTNVAFGKDITFDSLKADGYAAVFLAVGLHNGRRLGVENEDADGVLQGVDFLRDAAMGKEVSIGKDVLVIGGGNVAVDVALTAKRKGAQNVTMVCLEKRDEMPAWEHEIREALESDIKIVNSFGPKSFFIDQNKRFSGIEFKTCTAVFDENGRFNPAFDESACQAFFGDTLIIAIGQSTNTDGLKEQGVPLTRGGGMDADPVTLQTSLGWVFAGGDALYGPKSVVDAVACGKEAAESIHRFINNMDLTEGRQKEWTFEKPDVIGEPHKDRTTVRCLDPAARECNFLEVSYGYNETEARTEAERCLKCGICSECYQCVKACLAGAVDHNQHMVERDIEVGSVVLCPGNDVYDPSALEDIYHYRSCANVMTSSEFERILSASGPTMGHLVRMSDHKEPKRIAWLQCIGSRDTNRCGNAYCSSVCCMYAIKEAMIAKDHAGGDLETVIFNMDIRSFGKDYEKYYLRAKENSGVRFVKARIHTIDIIPETDNLLLRYVDEAGNMTHEEFDMVVLSVGLQVPPSTMETAKRLNITLNKHRFADTHPFTPVNTSRPGVFACGIFQGPKDIPSSVTEASAAACAAGAHLAAARGTLLKTVERPAEISLEGEEPRVGVFVCDCGINIAGVVDVPSIKEYAATLPYVVYSGENLFTCSQDAQELMKEIIKEHRINRVVVSSCTPKTHEAIFMDTLESVGLNKYLFEMANIRNQDSWVHSDAPEMATEKARELVRMSVARAASLRPLHERRIPVTKRALIVGGGIAGMTAALGIADQGFSAVLVEKEETLGGLGNRLTHTIEGMDIRAHVADLIGKVTAHPNIDVLTQSVIVDFSGFKGNFKTEVLVGESMASRKIEHGVVIMATGAGEYRPTEYLYGENPNVVTQLELSEKLEDKQYAAGLEQVVMIQCVGSRNESNPNCSRICCQSAVKNAIHIKRDNPEARVFILYRDIRTYGLMEDYYTEARRLGVMFFRFDPEDAPVAAPSGDLVNVTFTDHILGRKISVDAGLLVLSAGMVAEDTEELAHIMKTNRNPENYFIEAHVKLRPVEMGTEGFYLCGTAHAPKLVTESIAQAMAAASRATTMLAQPYLTLSAVVARVDQDLCASCLICVRSCPFGVPRINAEGVSEIDDALCQGCGACAAECPAKAIQLNWYEDDQIISKVDALLEGAQ